MKKQFKEEIYAFLGHEGVMLGSKTLYRKANPLNLIVFNANVCFVKERLEKKFFGLIKKRVTTAEKIWWGDFDLSKSWKALKNLAEATGETVVLLYEMDGRFEHVNSPNWENFVYKVTPDGSETLGESVRSYIMWTDDALTLIPDDITDSSEFGTEHGLNDTSGVFGEPVPADVQPTPEQIQEAIVALDEGIAEVQEKAKALKEKKPRASRKPKPNTAIGERPASDKPKAPRKPRKPKTDGSTEVVKKPRAPRKKKENNG